HALRVGPVEILEDDQRGRSPAEQADEVDPGAHPFVGRTVGIAHDGDQRIDRITDGIGSTAGGIVATTAGGTVASTAGGIVATTAGGHVGTTVGETVATTAGGTVAGTVGGFAHGTVDRTVVRRPRVAPTTGCARRPGRQRGGHGAQQQLHGPSHRAG